VKVKLDENIPRSAVTALAQAGHEADTVLEEGLAGASDEQVVHAASAERRLLITLDRGIGDIRTYPPGTHAGVLVLRPSDQSAGSVLRLLSQLLEGHELTALAGSVAVAQPGLLRIRRN